MMRWIIKEALAGFLNDFLECGSASHYEPLYILINWIIANPDASFKVEDPRLLNTDWKDKFIY